VATFTRVPVFLGEVRVCSQVEETLSVASLGVWCKHICCTPCRQPHAYELHRKICV